MKVIPARGKAFDAALKKILERGEKTSAKVEASVSAILEDVKRRGDLALIEYTRRFDGADIGGRLRVKESEISAAVKGIPSGKLKVMRLAAKRILAFHRLQLQKSWIVKDSFANVLGQKITPLERAGIYVPGGKAAYPSTVLMSALAASAAGVERIVMATPPSKDGRVNPYVLAAAQIAGVNEVYRIGGAQAIGALAFGTRTVPKVDKIVGPGNIYVATAKRLVFGSVDIDMVAGPSEILVINDGSGKAREIAADLLSQAEHDELASAVLITTSKRMADAVSAEVSRQLASLERKKIAAESIKRYGAIFTAPSLKEAAAISNRIAPEHLELYVRRPEKLLREIRNAGAVFLGALTPEAAGDYIAGPNHTLPTGGTARFSSPLGAYDFLKASSVIKFSKKGFSKLAGSIEKFSLMEGLTAHARSVTVRLKKS